MSSSNRPKVKLAALLAPRVERILFSVSWTERESMLGELRAKRNELSTNMGLELAL